MVLHINHVTTTVYKTVIQRRVDDLNNFQIGYPTISLPLSPPLLDISLFASHYFTSDMRRLIVCVDGAWEDSTDRIGVDSNILHLLRSIESVRLRSLPDYELTDYTG